MNTKNFHKLGSLTTFVVVRDARNWERKFKITDVPVKHRNHWKMARFNHSGGWKAFKFSL